MRKLALILLCTVGMALVSGAQPVTDLFTPRASLSKNFSKLVSKSQALTINHNKLAGLRLQSPAGFQLELPFEGASLVLELKKSDVITPGFRVTEKSGGGQEKTVNWSGGLFYQGKIRGKEHSMATISLVGDQVMGIISDETGNIILGAIEDKGIASEEYTLYRESALNVKNPSRCFASEEMIGTVPETTTSRGAQTGEPVEIYFECDYKLYTDRSSNSDNVVNFVLGFFNNTAAIYEAEDIKVQVSQITVWTTQDPEAAAHLNTADTVLDSFASRMRNSNYIGDYAHFLSRRNLGGGVAYVLGNPCASNVTRYYKTGVSAIDNEYLAYPTYSWTVQVVTHELGHNFGSNHTQWCGWTGGALDNCYDTEPVTQGGVACGPGPRPTNGGTIMSYCHLTGYGINFSNGFGVQPGNRIRQVIGNASCIGTCRMTVSIEKLDASCDQSNGSATVTAAASTGAVQYTWSNGQTGRTLVNAAPGTYNVTVKDASGCQVMEDVTIINSGSLLTFDLAPGATAGFCAGKSVELSATNNPAYTYVWQRNGSTISGQTTSTYTATQAGTYQLDITSGDCSGTKTVVVSQVATPTASIAASGATTFCDGGTVTLDAGIGSVYAYQWRRNGTDITGATETTYEATASGSYTVRVYAGSGCEATSAATLVTVNPVPVAAITASGEISFCEGKSVVLSTPADASYTYVWTRNASTIAGATGATYTATTAGTYRVLVNGSPCTSTSAPVIVTVFANPVVTISPAAVTIEKFNSVTLNLSGAPSYDFGAQPYLVVYTANSITVRPPTTTTYTIRGYDTHSCEDVVQSVVTVVGCGQVTDIDTANLSPSRVLVSWTNPQDVTTDTLQYRKVGETAWNKVFVNGDSYEVNGLEPGSAYEFSVTATCSTTSTFVASALQTINTPALSNGLFIRLFPNPATTTSRLEIISSTPYELSVAVYDHTGKMVAQPVAKGSYPAGQTIRTINAASLSAGIYHVAVRVNGKLETIRMMIVR